MVSCRHLPSIEIAQRTLELAKLSGKDQYIAEGLSALGDTHGMLDRRKVAEEYLEKGYQYSDKLTVDRRIIVECGLFLVDVRYLLGHPVEHLLHSQPAAAVRCHPGGFSTCQNYVSTWRLSQTCSSIFRSFEHASQSNRNVRAHQKLSRYAYPMKIAGKRRYGTLTQVAASPGKKGGQSILQRKELGSDELPCKEPTREESITSPSFRKRLSIWPE